jgi:hypothetical protein
VRDWKLVVEFDSLEDQQARDPENTFPNDETSRFVRYIAEYWNLLTEDLQDTDLLQWSPTEGTVVLFPEVLDYIAEPLEWLLMHTIPKKVELTR